MATLLHVRNCQNHHHRHHHHHHRRLLYQLSYSSSRSNRNTTLRIQKQRISSSSSSSSSPSPSTSSFHTFPSCSSSSPSPSSIFCSVGKSIQAMDDDRHSPQISAHPISTLGDFKLATFFSPNGGESVVGVVYEEQIWPLQDVLTDMPSDFDTTKIKDMIGVIQHWDVIGTRIVLKGSGIALGLVHLQAPIPRPSGAIMCVGKNYLDHVKEVDTWKVAPGIAAPDVPKHPIIFTKAPQSVIGPGDAIVYPHGVSSEVDYEAELAVIIGKEACKVGKDEAMSYIFGYTILNDVTARDLQKRHQQWFLGKSCDTFCPMGPYIVPASNLTAQDLQIQCWVNGELRQNGRTTEMIFSIPKLIEVISASTTLQPGDIIATGTPAGVGSGFNPPKHLLPGDVVTISIEGIGLLTNTVR